jgi:RNA polymerase nonessential primary-like sigma factor
MISTSGVAALTNRPSGAKTINIDNFISYMLKREYDDNRVHTECESRGFSRYETAAAIARQKRNILLESHLYLVEQIARFYWRPDIRLPKGELIQEGCQGLMRAVTKFRPELGYKFSTYAVPWIRCYMQQAIQTCYSSRERSMDEDVYREGGITLHDVNKDDAISPERAVIERQQLRTALKALDELPYCQHHVLRRRLGLDDGGEVETLQHIAEDIDLSRERVRQIEQTAIKKIRSILGIKKL